MPDCRSVLWLATALARRPDLWPAVARLIPPSWWRRFPPRPWPPADYIRFRVQTMYGSPPAKSAGGLDADGLIAYLEWCRRMHQRAR